jgi:hypothetical protein
MERKQTEKQKYARFFYLSELPAREHTVEQKITELPAGTAYYLGQVLVVVL